MNVFQQTDIDTLRAGVTNLPADKQSFALSLMSQATAGKRLSDKQWAWISRLAAMTTEPAKAAPATAEVGNFAGVIELFETAKKHLKHPRLRLQLEDGRPISLSMAGASSRRPGTINVTDGGRFGSNIWYGRVDKDGAWDKSHAVDDATADLLSQLLGELASDPAGTAAKYGKLTGYCCFCNTALTDERSTDVGYGPVCAKKWHLPWGSKAQRDLLAA